MKSQRVRRKLRRVMQLPEGAQKSALQEFFMLIIGDVLLCVCMLVSHIYISIYTPRRHTSCIAIGALI